MRDASTALPEGAADPIDSHSRVQSVDRAARLLRAIAQAGDGDTATTRLAATCGLNRATAWRLLTTLEVHGLVTREPSSTRWAIGSAFAEIAGVSHADLFRRNAHDQLVRLSERTGETAAFAVPGPDGLTYVDEVAPDSVVAATWHGRTVPLHATSTGKAMLAFSAVPGQPSLDPPLTRYTETTVTRPAALEAELVAARRIGYAVCRGEYDPAAWGVSSTVVGAGGVVAVISVWGPAGRVTEATFDRIGPMVADTARRLSLRPAG